MKLVKINVKGTANLFIARRNNSLIFIDYTEDLKGAYFWMKDSTHARYDAELCFDSVEFLETKEL